MDHLDSRIIGARRAVDAPATSIIVAQPIDESVLREAARQVGVPDTEPIPDHIRNAAVSLINAYANMDRPPTQETIQRRFLSDVSASTKAQDVRLAIMTFGSVLTTLQESLRIMREEIDGSGTSIAEADPEVVWRAFQTHVGSSLDLLDQIRDRLEEAMSHYRATVNADPPIS